MQKVKKNDFTNTANANDLKQSRGCYMAIQAYFMAHFSGILAAFNYSRQYFAILGQKGTF